MPNNRIFYASQGVAISAPDPGTTSTKGVASATSFMHGVQSVGITTNFNLEQAFELGQIQIYENIEGMPDIEVTCEKVLDGYPLLYTTATRGAGSAQVAANNSLVNRSAEKCTVSVGIYSDTKDVLNNNNQVAEVYMSGMFINNVSYTIPTEGNCTESVTFVGNDKRWSTAAVYLDQTVLNTADIEDTSDNTGKDKPKNNQSGTFKGGIQRRENVAMGSCIIPASVIRAADPNHPAISTISKDYGNNGTTGGNPTAHIQNISISTDFGREDINELGRKGPYFRAANFPIEVTCEIEVIATDGDFVQAYREGDPSNDGTVDEGNNTPEETIVIGLQDGTFFDLGKKNRLASVSYGGGDAGGGNATMTFSYTTFNELRVTPPNGGAS
jgi:hypothetical protein